MNRSLCVRCFTTPGQCRHYHKVRVHLCAVCFPIQVRRLEIQNAEESARRKAAEYAEATQEPVAA